MVGWYSTDVLQVVTEDLNRLLFLFLRPQKCWCTTLRIWCSQWRRLWERPRPPPSRFGQTLASLFTGSERLPGTSRSSANTTSSAPSPVSLSERAALSPTLSYDSPHVWTLVDGMWSSLKPLLSLLFVWVSYLLTIVPYPLITFSVFKSYLSGMYNKGQSNATG